MMNPQSYSVIDLNGIQSLLNGERKEISLKLNLIDSQNYAFEGISFKYKFLLLQTTSLI